MKESFPVEQENKEESINAGLGVLIKEKELYYGSNIKGIEQLRSAENTTVGEGVYFTSKKEDALGYATRRVKNPEGGESNVYSAKIENLKFLDLRNLSNMLQVLEGFKLVLEDVRKSDLPWHLEAVIDSAIEAISKKEVTNLKQIAQGLGRPFTDYVKSLGYDGIITIEGGEGDEIGEHDTYLLFDPANIKNLSQI